MHMQEHQAKLNFNTYKCQECEGILRKVIFIKILFILFKIFLSTIETFIFFRNTAVTRDRLLTELKVLRIKSYKAFGGLPGQ